MFKQNKKAVIGGGVWVIIVIGLLIVGAVTWVAMKPAGTTLAPGQDIIDIVGCSVEDTTVTFSAVNEYTQAASGGSHRYSANGAPPLVVSDAGTATLSPGDVVDVLFMNATSGTYFSELSEGYVIPCKGTDTISAEVTPNGTITIQVFNENGVSVGTTGTNNETLGADEEVALDFNMKGTGSTGMPHGGIINVEFNDTEIDNVKLKIDGVYLEQVSSPPVYTPTMGGDSQEKAYLIPAMAGTTKVEGQIEIDTDDSNNPVAGTQIILELRPYDYYVDTDTGVMTSPNVDDNDDTVTFNQVTTFRLGIL